MQTGSMRCSRCGMTQLASQTCKSCGAKATSQAIGRIWGDGSQPFSFHSSAQPASPAAATGAVESLPYESAGATGIPDDAAGRAQMTDSAEIRQLFFFGNGGSLFGIHIVNTLLTLLSIGTFYFWAKARVRRYLFGQTEFEGDRFSYLGTGRELLFGFLKAALVIGGLSAILKFARFISGGMIAQVSVYFTAYFLLFLFIPLAMVGGRRYRLSRTAWRGIRFSFRGGAGPFILLFLKGFLLTLLTLSLYTPFFIVQRYGFMTSNSYFGNRKFDFNGSGRALLPAYLLAVLLVPLTLGLYWFGFQAQKQRFLWNHTSFGAAQFKCTVGGFRLFALKFTNLLLLIFTLGVAWPWVQVRNIKFAFRYLSLEGPIDLETIQQDAQGASPTGEGLSDLLDLDTGLNAA